MSFVLPAGGEKSLFSRVTFGLEKTFSDGALAQMVGQDSGTGTLRKGLLYGVLRDSAANGSKTVRRYAGRENIRICSDDGKGTFFVSCDQRRPAAEQRIFLM